MIMTCISRLLDDDQDGFLAMKPRQRDELILLALRKNYAGENPDLRDPWGKSYNIRVDSRGLRVWSSGPNGVDDSCSGDDVVRGDGYVEIERTSG